MKWSCDKLRQRMIDDEAMVNQTHQQQNDNKTKLTQARPTTGSMRSKEKHLLAGLTN